MTGSDRESPLTSDRERRASGHAAPLTSDRERPAAIDGSPIASWLGASVPVTAFVAIAVIAAAAGVGAPMSWAARGELWGALAAIAVAAIGDGPAALGDLVLASVVSGAIASAGPAALALDGSFATPLVAQDPGQRTLLAARAALLLLAALRIPRGRGYTARLAPVGAVFVASVVARGFFVPAAVAGVIVLRRSGLRAANAAPLGAIVVLAAAPILALVRPRPVAAPPEIDGPPAAQIAAWRSRHNLFHAHAVAEAWARSEAVPGEGHLALAAIDHDVGHDAKAAKVLAKIFASDAPDEVRRAALDDKTRWGLP